MRLALFAHLVAFAFGFGTVMVVDISGLLWVLRRIPAEKLLWLTGIGQKIIWSSVAVLVVSGGILLPEVLSARTKLKLLAVVILVVNGMFLDRMRRRLQASGENDFWKLPRDLQIQSVVSISLSQLLWWTAVIIGFLNSSSHTLH